MASPSPPKRIKSDLPERPEPEESRDTDSETQKALEEIDSCQNLIDELSEKASEDILKVEQKYNKLRKPFFEKRSNIIKKMPNFWILAIANHQILGKIVAEEECDCLRYLSQIEVEEFDDIKMGYRISFHFDPNPFFENTVLTKEIYLSGQDATTKSTPIKWREGQNLIKIMRDLNSSNPGRKPFERTTFFTWYEDPCKNTVDEIAEIIKDDFWPNPLQYFLASPSGDDDTNGASSQQEEEESDEDGEVEVVGDDIVIVEDEEDYIQNDEDEEDEEEKYEEEKDDEDERDVEIEKDDDENESDTEGEEDEKSQEESDGEALNEEGNNIKVENEENEQVVEETIKAENETADD